MQHIEHQRELPKELKIPNMRTKYSLEEEKIFKDLPDYSDRESYNGRLSSSGYLWLEGSDISQVIEKPEHLFAIIEKHRHTILIMPMNRVSILWKGFSDSFKEKIAKDPNLWASEDSWIIRRVSYRQYLFRKGNKWHNLWILDVKTKNTKDPNKLTGEYFRLDKIGLTPNLNGMPATGRDFLFGPDSPGYESIREEFQWIRRLDPELVEKIYSACKRPAMVCKTLGRTPPAYNEDMRKAFLQGLIHAPTMNPYLTIPDHTPTFDPDANHGRYLIEITFPPIWTFTPNLFRAGDPFGDYGVICPTGGPQIQEVGQLRMKLYDHLRIPFKVLEAFKLLPNTGGPVYPWKTRGGFLELIIETIKKKFPDIEANLLYQAAIGSLLTHYEYHNKVGDNKVSTLNVFNPLLELFIYEWVFINNWLRMDKNPNHNQLALRIDACSVLDHKGFNPDTSGLYRLETPYPTEMFFANPRQKDKSIKVKAPYYDAVKEAADNGNKEVVMRESVVGTLEMLLEGLIDKDGYGRHVTLKSKLSLSGETRIPSNKKYKEEILPKDLVDSQIELVDPNLE